MSTEYKGTLGRTRQIASTLGGPLRTPCLVTAALAASLLAASWRDPAPATPAFVLFQKAKLQGLRDLRGVTVRLLEDADGDLRADTVVLFDSSGRPVRAEVDSDRDGVVDRWETLRANGTAERVARANRATGRPDRWEYLDLTGRPYRRDLDRDGDGRVDQIFLLGPHGTPLVEERDDDGDGRLERVAPVPRPALSNRGSSRAGADRASSTP
jgi:hypothetical protein